MTDNGKRKAYDSGAHDSKRAKTKKQWRVPRQSDHGGFVPPTRIVQPGDSGIWVTCDKGKERKCIGEMRDLFSEYTEELYPAAGTQRVEPQSGVDAEDVERSAAADIENEIAAEINDMKQDRGKGPQLFTPVWLDMPCVLFFKTQPPIEPVSFVQRICEDALANPHRKRTRFAKRLSPMTLIGRASVEGLDKVAREVLKHHFHQEPFQQQKFAIRPTLRNHNVLSRDIIIKQVATIVGPGHKVDLQNYDRLIIVEVYQHVCGISVLDKRFEALKRYNLAEIFDPTPKDTVEAAPKRVVVETVHSQ